MEDTSRRYRTTIPKAITEVTLGRELQVIDTIGYLSKDDPDVPTQMNHIFEKQGVDAILMVIKCHSDPHKIKKMDLDSLLYIKKILGNDFWDFCIVVVTYGKAYENFARSRKVRPTFEEELLTHRFAGFDESILDPWISLAKGGAVLFENRDSGSKERKDRVTNLIEKIEMLCKINKGKQFKAACPVPKKKWWKFQRKNKKSSDNIDCD